MKANDYFTRRQVRFETLLKFGFKKNGAVYTYEAMLLDGQFKMTVQIHPDETVQATVLDVDTDEAYVLHQTDAQGEFVGRVRKEYEAVLSRINEGCFENAVFKSPMAREVIAYIRQNYGDDLEFLWKRFPDYAVFRRKESQKWYAVLLIIPKSKLGLDGDEKIEILDVRMHLGHKNILIDNKKYFEAYHMNKQHWLSVLLDGSVDMPELARRIDDSYILAK